MDSPQESDNVAQKFAGIDWCGHANTQRMTPADPA
jgi:hypothetical protein